MNLTLIGKELAIPFVVDYTRRWNIAFSEDGSQNVQWVGAWDGPCLRAVLGLQDVENEPEAVFVYGFYGDGSERAAKALSALAKALDKVPNTLYGQVYLPNLTMVRAAVRRGWKIVSTSVQHGRYYINRPKKVAA